MNFKRISLIIAFLFVCGMTAHETDAQIRPIEFSSVPAVSFPASSLSWNGVYGDRQENIYAIANSFNLVGKVPGELEKLRRSWLAKHPQARAFVMSKWEWPKQNVSDDTVSLEYLRVFDSADDLNVYLVSQGVFSARQMLLRPGAKTSVTQQEYTNFVDQLIAAEKSAKVKKLGVWK